MQFTNLPLCAEFDRELLQRVEGFLHQQGYAIFRTLKIRIERDVVLVQGCVPSFYLRQIAVGCVKRVAGVRQVIDELQVDPHKGCGIQSLNQGLLHDLDDERHRRDDLPQALRRPHGDAVLSLHE